MNTKIYRFLVPLLVLMLASLACATLSGGNPTIPTVIVPTVDIPTVEIPSVEIPTVTVPDVTNPTPAPEGGDSGQGTTAGADSLNLDDPTFFAAPAEVNSYRLNLVFTFSGQAPDGTPINGSIQGEGAYSVDPAQLSFIFQTSSADVPAGTIEIVQMDNNLYMSSPDLGCFSLPVDEAETSNPYEELLDTGGFLTGQATRIQPDETINGIPVYVYEITSANLDTSDPTTQEVTEITFGRLYLAQDGGYIVRLVMDGRGKNTVASEVSDLIGDVHYEINYSDYNQPVNIAIPAGCTEDAGGGVTTGSSDYPLPDDAADLFSMTGITTYSSGKTVEELTTFYKTELVAAGWTMGEEITLPGLVTLTFTKDGKTATVTITADPSTGKTQVAIFEG
ncbi:MAG: hypothetical protein HUU38_00305 [Anaerolineales bacterium]|nr:hypothetical protein [Anaerolineales bacterium]